MSQATAAVGHQRVTILGSTLDLQPLPEVMKRVGEWIRHPDGRCHRVIVTGFHGLWEASEDPQLRMILNSADLWLPDGIAPVWVARLRGHRDLARIPGAELMRACFEQGQGEGYRHFFYGDTDEVLAALRTAVETNWPGNVVAGCLSPPFRMLSQDEIESHIRIVNDARPDFVWVGLGMPKQDRWIYEHRLALRVPVAVGVGAAFSFTSGSVQRVPEWIGRFGLEWAYRLIKEPRKCWRRSLVQGPQFVLRVLREQLRWRKPR